MLHTMVPTDSGMKILFYLNFYYKKEAWASTREHHGVGDIREHRNPLGELFPGGGVNHKVDKSSFLFSFPIYNLSNTLIEFFGL